MKTPEASPLLHTLPANLSFPFLLLNHANNFSSSFIEFEVKSFHAIVIIAFQI